MDMCGQLLARVFAGFGISKVLTAQTGGLPPAHAVAWSQILLFFPDRDLRSVETAEVKFVLSIPTS